MTAGNMEGGTEDCVSSRRINACSPFSSSASFRFRISCPALLYVINKFRYNYVHTSIYL